MEKAYAYLGAAAICITYPLGVYAIEQKKKPEFPDYWVCTPVFVQIDYSYLRTGEWIGKEFREEIGMTTAKINNHSNNVERTWGLVNCTY